MKLTLHTIFLLAVLLDTGLTDSSDWLKRIIGGQESKENEWPWLVNILVLNPETGNYIHRCGGTLIDAEWVLTAAHCLAFKFDGKYLIKLGEHNQNELSGNEKDHYIEYFFIHPRFITETQFAYDIALIKLTKAAAFSQYVDIIGLPSKTDYVPDGTKCLVAGWGQISSSSPSKSAVVRHVEIPIVSYETCAAVNNEFPYSNVSQISNICGGDVKTDNSACNGDSGGPLVCRNRAGKYVLQGIVSWGDEFCRSHFYSVFTKVKSFVPWITYMKTQPAPQLDRGCEQDYHYYCKKWNEMNYCGIKYIQWNCPKTCDACNVAV